MKFMVPFNGRLWQVFHAAYGSPTNFGTGNGGIPLQIWRGQVNLERTAAFLVGWITSPDSGQKRNPEANDGAGGEKDNASHVQPR
jgi:hypothetical protein